MNQINPEKLLLSKWTARQPQHREKHFLVTKLLRDEQERVIGCLLEAVLSRRSEQIDWRQLRESEHWLPGWR
ncbi:TIGR02450 family Trp-rich protein [Stagnimonas aquatica]|uniref:TIGR02450 family Trp-rich protein n=1 Tax=Stagnimonas aquatica TaxID=2689987 RepID=A0A3N0VLP6_9GAMM|nr:TIGR02450 family Trp-rich protein [Stagnimonas aquatica]ROH93682.1 TIGR02450 family Trp-rich protein [Stagnimonas aquatica]